jgi:hypothetical protein
MILVAAFLAAAVMLATPAKAHASTATASVSVKTKPVYRFKHGVDPCSTSAAIPVNAKYAGTITLSTYTPTVPVVDNGGFGKVKAKARVRVPAGDYLLQVGEVYLDDSGRPMGCALFSTEFVSRGISHTSTATVSQQLYTGKHKLVMFFNRKGTDGPVAMTTLATVTVPVVPDACLQA